MEIYPVLVRTFYSGTRKSEDYKIHSVSSSDDHECIKFSFNCSPSIVVYFCLDQNDDLMQPAAESCCKRGFKKKKKKSIRKERKVKKLEKVALGVLGMYQYTVMVSSSLHLQYEVCR